MRWMCFIIWCLFVTNAAAQKDSVSNKIHFQGSVAGNLLLGDSEYGYAAKVTAGAGFRQWQIGVGGGYDHYFFRTYPLFATAGIDVFKRWRLTAEGGINLPEQRVETVTSWSTTRLYNGRYGAGFVQYRLHTWRKKNLFAGLGYSWKSLKYEEKSSAAWPLTTQYNYRFSRVALQLVLGF